MRAILIKLTFIFTHTIVVLIYDKISGDKITKISLLKWNLLLQRKITSLQ